MTQEELQAIRAIASTGAEIDSATAIRLLDEIELLRRELERAEDECTYWWEQSKKKDTEIKRLRGALEHYRNRCSRCGGKGELHISGGVFECNECKTARQALEG